MDSVREDDLPPFDSATATSPAGACAGNNGQPAETETPHHTVAWYVLVALIPLAAFTGIVTLLAMAGNAAAATGGCGGG